MLRSPFVLKGVLLVILIVFIALSALDCHVLISQPVEQVADPDTEQVVELAGEPTVTETYSNAFRAIAVLGLIELFLIATERFKLSVVVAVICVSLTCVGFWLPDAMSLLEWNSLGRSYSETTAVGYIVAVLAVLNLFVSIIAAVVAAKSKPLQETLETSM